MSDLISVSGAGSQLSQSLHEQTALLSGLSPYGASVSQNLLFIDSAVSDIDSLIRGAKSSSVFVLDPNRDGVEQILDTLANYQNIESVHIVSHGAVGSLQLGNTYLSTQTLPYYGLKLQQSAQSLAPDADILLYGCDVGADENGLAFLRSLQQLTGADIAASTDLTGDMSKGGDWDLEAKVGSIEAGSIFDPQTLQQYSGILPTTYVSDLNWTMATNGWGAIEKDKSNGEAATGDGKALTLNGVTYAKGLGVHAGSEINYTLGGAYTNFSSNIGVDDEVGNNGSVIFQVWVDGIKLFTSTKMTGASATQLVNLDVTGKQSLKLIVTNSGDDNSFDHADWADAKLTSGGTPPAPPADTTAPTATLTAAALNTALTTPYTFTVTYADATAVNLGTINGTAAASDIRVTGANGFSQLATLVGVTPNANSPSLTATYQITAPDGIWNANDNSTYTATLLAGQVSDTLGNTTAANLTLGTFQVAVPAGNPTGNFIYLSDLNAISSTNAWGVFEKDRSNGEQGATDGKALTLNGVTYAKGLGVHAGSEIIYNLGGNYTNFSSNIGVDDEVGNSGSVVFQVFVDGIQLFTSNTLTGASATQLVNLNVTGKQTLRLVVTNGGDDNSLDHADWADAKLTPNGNPPPPPPGDTAAPTATLNAATLIATSNTPYTFTVAYADATAVDVSTINNTDIRVSGPNGFTQLAQRVNVTPNANGQSLTATYQIAAPDGIWNWNDNGTYTATLLAGEVRDTLGNATANTQLGTFQVGIQSTIVIGRNSSQVNEGGTVTIPIQRLGDTSGTASVQYFTGGNATATADVDYTSIPLTRLVFAPGETEKQITIQTLNDAIAEQNEVFSLLIDGTQGADLGPSRTSQITIVDPTAPPVNSVTYLSDLTPTASTNGWGPIERDKSNGENAAGDGKVLTLNGATYNKGLGVHAGSEIDYALGGVYNNFVSYVGLDDEVGGSGSVVFQVWADGVKLYDSGVMTGVSETKLVNVDVTGKQNLKLIVTNGGDNDSSDHADWANAQLVIGNVTPPPPPGPAPTGNFTREQVVGGLNKPTTFDWSPDGQRMYIAQQNGVVRVSVNGVLQAQAFIDISAQVNEDHDRGLLGMAIDPAFGKNQGRDYVYLLFTYDPPETQGQNGLAGPDGGGNRPSRLIRVTANPATNYTTALPNSEVVLLGKNSLWQYTSRPDADSTSDFTILPSGIVNGTTINAPAALIEDPDPANVGRDYKATDTNFVNNNNIRDYLATDSNTHSIGQVHFGLDGSLYVSVGDGTSYNEVDPRATRVQDIDNLSGKLLRIDPLTGKGFADNPFYNGNADSNRSKVWSYGFRNPFRFTIQPGTGTPYIGDVGWNTWEEVNVATKGGNFGWPYFEGNPQNQGYSTLPQAQAFYNSGQPVVNALLTGNHNGATAWIMGDFYTGNTFPAAYKGALFYNDVGYGNIYVTFLNPDGTAGATQEFDKNLPYIVDMETGPDGNLYYANLYGGSIGRWKPA